MTNSPKRTGCEALERREKLQENVRQPEYYIARYKKLKTVENQRAADPRKISSRSSRKLMRKIKQNPLVTRQELQNDLFSSGICVSKRTISNEIHRNNLKSRSPRTIPLLVRRHRDTRLKLVREHKDKENSYWERVLWTEIQN